MQSALLRLFFVTTLMYVACAGQVQSQVTVRGITGERCVEDDWHLGNLDTYGNYMDYYVEGSRTIVDCFRHPHPNGLDDVFVPGAWGDVADLQGPAARWIEAAYEAIEMTRAQVQGLDGALEKGVRLFILYDLRDIDPISDLTTGSAALTAPSYLSDTHCLISYQGRDKFDANSLVGDSLELGKFIISHEVGHCYQHQKLGTSLDDWVAESFANFVATQTYPSANGEHLHLTGTERYEGFDLENNDFRQEYGGFLLFEYIASKRSLSAAWETIKRLAATNEAAEQYRIIDGAMDFHQFLTDYIIVGIEDPGGCGGSTCRYPLANGKLYNTIGSNTEQYRPVYSTSPGSNSLPLPPVPPGRYVPIRIIWHEHRTDTVTQVGGAAVDVTFGVKPGISASDWIKLRDELILAPSSCALSGGTHYGFISHLEPDVLTGLTIEMTSSTLPGCRYQG